MRLRLSLLVPMLVGGRGKKLVPFPVKAKALELGFRGCRGNRMTPEVVEALQAAQADIFWCGCLWLHFA